MATKNELRKELEELRKQINAITQAINENEEIDADNLGATVGTIQKRAKIQADDVKANIFNANIGEKSVEQTIFNLNAYRLSPDMGVEYWYRFCRGIKKQVAAIEFYTPAREIEEKLELALMYAIGFNEIGFTNKDGIYDAVIISGRKGPIITGIRLKEGISTGNILNYGAGINEGNYIDLQSIPQQEEQFVDKKDIITFKGNIEGIPDYVLMIPGIGKQIFYERQKEKNIAFANIIPIVKAGSQKQRLEIGKLLTDCSVKELYLNYDAQNTNANQSGGSFLDKIKGYIPPPEIVEFFNVLDANYRRHMERGYTEFGGPIAETAGQQVLAANATMELADVENIALSKYRRLARFLGDCVDILGIPLEFPEFDMVNSLGGIPNSNNNAMKAGIITANEEALIDQGVKKKK